MRGARPLKDAEVTALLEKAFAPRLRMLVALLCHSGARISEGLSLGWADVHDFSTGKTRDAIVYVKSRTKGKRVSRIVPVNAILAAELARYWYAADNRWPSGPLLSTRKGRWSRSAATRAFTELVELVGLSGVSSQSCRKWYATEIVGRGGGVRDVQALLGHADLRTTQEYLDVPTAAQLRAAVDRLATTGGK